MKWVIKMAFFLLKFIHVHTPTGMFVFDTLDKQASLCFRGQRMA